VAKKAADPDAPCINFRVRRQFSLFVRLVRAPSHYLERKMQRHPRGERGAGCFSSSPSCAYLPCVFASCGAAALELLTMWRLCLRPNRVGQEGDRLPDRLRMAVAGRCEQDLLVKACWYAVRRLSGLPSVPAFAHHPLALQAIAENSRDHAGRRASARIITGRAHCFGPNARAGLVRRPAPGSSRWSKFPTFRRARPPCRSAGCRHVRFRGQQVTASRR
jgi:hypothetical protein